MTSSLANDQAGGEVEDTLHSEGGSVSVSSTYIMLIEESEAWVSASATKSSSSKTRMVSTSEGLLGVLVDSEHFLFLVGGPFLVPLGEDSS